MIKVGILTRSVRKIISSYFLLEIVVFPLSEKSEITLMMMPSILDKEAARQHHHGPRIDDRI